MNVAKQPRSATEDHRQAEKLAEALVDVFYGDPLYAGAAAQIAREIGNGETTL